MLRKSPSHASLCSFFGVVRAVDGIDGHSLKEVSLSRRETLTPGADAGISGMA